MTDWINDIYVYCMSAGILKITLRLEGCESLDSDVSGDFLDKALKYVARSYLHEVPRTVSHHVLHCLGPLHRGSELCKKVLLDSIRIGGRKRSDVLVYRAYRCLERSGLDCFCEFCTCRLHQRRVECASDFEHQGPLCTCCKHLVTYFLDGVDFS